MTTRLIRTGLAISLLGAVLAACGGGGGSGTGTSAPAAAPVTSAQSVSLGLSPAVKADLATLVATPAFHIAPVNLDEPGDADQGGSNASATQAVHVQAVPAALGMLASNQLTAQAIAQALASGGAGGGISPDSGIRPLGSGAPVATYTPAQIRAAYGLPALPPVGATLSASTAAQLGAGQTIYLIDAKDDPNSASELAAFNQKFGLPTCTTVAVPTGASLPLAAPASGCSYSVVYSNASGAMVASAPAYDSGWATEIALDVQWSHAIAPLARIVLIEAPDASLSSLLGAIQLANAMGPGIVSMSFGAGEGSWTGSVDSAFGAANMTYLAATGDSGAGVQWPAVSSHVLAVGGTTLTYTSGSARSETAWSSGGGGVSQYVATPAYQTAAVPGLGTLAHRAVADVSFNADPSTGEYLAVISPGSTTVGWYSAGGTSLATPQWAGVIAIANALRAQGGQGVLGAPHALLYGSIAQSATNYGGAFADITQGSDGSCATCAAHTGYDEPTGLGTPNASALIGLLVGTPATPTAPVVGGATINGTVGTPLSFAVQTTAAHPVTFALSGAPAGMTVSANGTVSWASPALGTYTVTVTVHDTQNGLNGSGVYTVKIAAAAPPAVTGATVKGIASTPLTFQVTDTAVNPVTFSLAGAPSGMTVNASGLVSWPKPATGSYNVTVSVKDTRTLLVGSAVYAVTIAPPVPPQVNGATISVAAGSSLSFPVSVADANPVSFTLGGAPSWLSVSATGVLGASAPVAGSYTFTVKATDQVTGLTGQATFTLNVTTGGPVITATKMSGVVGQQLSGTITFADSTSNTLAVTISGAPSGMGFALGSSSVTVTWTPPAAGTYSLSVSAKDGAGKTASLSIPITVTAH